MHAATPLEDLPRQLREADAEELLRLVGQHAQQLEVAAVRQALANPFAGREVIVLVAAQQRLLCSYEVRRELARHAAAPEAIALRFLSGLYWRDLVELGLDVRVRPVIRRGADLYLNQRLPSLAVGERMAVARRAGHGVLARLRHDPNPRVIAALLENPRLTEGMLAPLVRRSSTPPAILELVAENPRWGVRYPVRVGLARNPSTPQTTALGLLPSLKKGDQRAVAADRRLSPAVRRRARLLAGGEPASGGRRQEAIN
jgi:hypothetical protein